jgi:hypothetical protein
MVVVTSAQNAYERKEDTPGQPPLERGKVERVVNPARTDADGMCNSNFGEDVALRPLEANRLGAIQHERGPRGCMRRLLQHDGSTVALEPAGERPNSASRQLVYQGIKEAPQVGRVAQYSAQGRCFVLVSKVRRHDWCLDPERAVFFYEAGRLDRSRLGRCDAHQQVDQVPGAGPTVSDSLAGCSPEVATSLAKKPGGMTHPR